MTDPWRADELGKAIAALREYARAAPVAPPSAAEIDAVERALGTTVHPDLRRLLLEAGNLYVSGKELASVLPGRPPTLVESTRDAWREGVPRDHVVFCEDNGDYHCIRPDGSVLFVSHHFEPQSWPDLTTWIRWEWLEGEADAAAPPSVDPAAGWPLDGPALDIEFDVVLADEKGVSRFYARHDALLTELRDDELPPEEARLLTKASSYQVEGPRIQAMLRGGGHDADVAQAAAMRAMEDWLRRNGVEGRVVPPRQPYHRRLP